MAEAARTANVAQERRWNGEGGQFWIVHRERHLAGHRSLLPHLFGAAAISPGARVLDVGCGCGETTITAARAGGGAIGLDLSGPMLEVARGLAAQPCPKVLTGDTPQPILVEGHGASPPQAPVGLSAAPANADSVSS